MRSFSVFTLLFSLTAAEFLEQMVRNYIDLPDQFAVLGDSHAKKV